MKFVIEGLGLIAGGGKTGMLRLLPSLAKHTRHEFVLLLPNLPEYSTARATNLKLVLRPKPGNLLARHLYLNHTVPKICREEGADALLCMGNFVPLRPRIPTVLFVQNPNYTYHEPVAYERATLRERAIIRYARRCYRRLSPSVRVVVQTEVMKRRMAVLYNLDPSRIVVIADTDALPATCTGQVRQRERAASDPFTFLCLAVYSAHKNLEILLEATKKLSAYTSRPARCLITIAPQQHPGARRLLEQVKREKLEDLLMNIGPVSGAELERAYMLADAAIQPTLLESFGRVYYESMRFNLPVLTSDRDFARHVCHDAAVYFDPLDADSVARAMAAIMEDENLRSRLVENGRRIVQQIPSWDEVAARFVEVLERTAGGHLAIDGKSESRHQESPAPM
jgi:glycosyltransferase involved in cell wall biosynthesis